MNIFSEIDKENGIEPEKHSLIEDLSPSTEVKIIDESNTENDDVKIIEKKTKKKCIYISADGKKCRRKAEDGNIYCMECLEKQPIKTEEKPVFKPLTIDTCTKTMFALHITSYMLIERLSQFTDNKMCGLVDELKDDAKELKEIYENLVDFYGQETIAKFLNPMVSLSLIGLKHGVSALEKGKKKE